jgi:hypothetical protein
MIIKWSHTTTQEMTQQKKQWQWKDKFVHLKRRLRRSTLWCCKSFALSRNLSLGLVTKAKDCKGAHQEGSPGVTSHAPGSVGKCEGMNPHTPKWAPTLGVGVLMDSQVFRERLQGPKPIELKNSLYHWKDLGT